MNYARILTNDLVNGEGISVSLFVTGCTFHCPGCFNQDIQDFKAGTLFTDKDLQYIKEKLIENNLIRNFSILGGEPLHPDNRAQILSICKNLKEEYPFLRIYLWTGYLIKEIQKEFPEILQTVDVVIDGKFYQNQRDVRLKLRGSANQNIWRKNEEGVFYKDELI